MNRKRVFVFLLAAWCLTGCGIFPKEDELQKTPIIQAYQQEEFRMAKVKRGDLQLTERLNAVCMNMNEKKYSFEVNDLNYEGVFVKNGDHVEAGTVLARLVNNPDSRQIANERQLELTADEAGKVVFARIPDAQEKSISGQLMIVINSGQGYNLSAYSKNWSKFEKGMQVDMRIAGKDYKAQVISAEDIGLEKTVRPENPNEDSVIYFHVDAEGLYLQSTESGSVNILVDERKNVLYVQESAITTVNDKEIVYVEDKDGIRSVKYIETGLHTDNKVEIVSGLEEGDSVILE